MTVERKESVPNRVRLVLTEASRFGIGYESCLTQTGVDVVLENGRGNRWVRIGVGQANAEVVCFHEPYCGDRAEFLDVENPEELEKVMSRISVFLTSEPGLEDEIGDAVEIGFTTQF